MAEHTDPSLLIPMPQQGWVALREPQGTGRQATTDGFYAGSEPELTSLGAQWGAPSQLQSPRSLQPVFETSGSRLPVINEHFPSLGPCWGTDGMWLWPFSN